MIEINDIKPIVKIPDLSIYIYYTLFIVAFLLLVVIIFYLYKFFKKKPKTIEQKYYEKLQHINFENSKQSAYLISKYGKLLVKEERQIRLFEELNDELEVYKYKKEITIQISEKIKTKFHIFMESLDVK